MNNPTGRRIGGRTAAFRRPETGALLLALALCNLPLLGGAPARGLAFFPEAVASGEWWRLFTWSFVHASPYHFLLDAAAFLLLYSGLESPRPAVRLLYLAGSATGSLLLPLWIAPEIRAIGLCGLSGVAHGLLAVTALELLSGHPRGSTLFRAGALLLVGVFSKSLLELATGEVLFSALHLGSVGHPVAPTHAGGTLGGMAAYALTKAGGASWPVIALKKKGVNFMVISFGFMAALLAPGKARSQSAPPVIDMHCHIAGIGAGGSGCFVSPKLRKNWRFSIYLRAFGVTSGEMEREGDALVFRRLSGRLGASREVSGAVVLALDGVVDGRGHLDLDRTEVYVPGEWVAREVRKYPNLYYGASVNPYRPDALERLEEAVREGAVLMKWLPSIQQIDPADPRLVPFYLRLKELGVPLLTHTGYERSFTGARHELCDPARLRLPLELGVTVIAAHAGTSGKTGGEDNMTRLLKLFPEFPNLYADISSLTQLNKLLFLPRLLRHPEVFGRLLYGTDFPLIATPLVSPWYFAPRLGIGGSREVLRTQNPWDRDVRLKRALGVPPKVFTRPAELLRIPPPEQ